MTLGWAFFSFYPITVFPVLEGMFRSITSTNPMLKFCSTPVAQRLLRKHCFRRFVLGYIHAWTVFMEPRHQESAALG